MPASKPILELELRPVAAPSAASPGAVVFVLLPALETLVGQPGFGRNEAICLPASPRPYSARAFFSRTRRPVGRVH